MTSPIRIAIVGAGVSGLAAAIELASTPSNRPLEITVFEERQTAGGRTRSFVEKVSGDTIDNGQHLMMGCYTSTLSYLEHISSAHLLRIENPLSIPYFEKNTGYAGTLKVSSSLPIPSNLFFGIMQTDLLSSFEKFAALRFGRLVMSRKFDPLFAHKTCSEAFAITKQPETLVKKLWEPIILATLNTSISEASAEVFLTTIRTIFLTERNYSAILIPTVGLSELLIDPAVALLESKGHTVKLATKVTGLTHRDGKVTVEFEDHSESFDAAIIASSPTPDWATVFGTNPMPSVRFSSIVNVYFWIDKQILEHPINGFIYTTLHWCFPKKTSYGKQLLACTVSAAGNLAELELAEISRVIERDLRSSLPHSSFTILNSLVMKEKRATVVLDPPIQDTRPPLRTNIPSIAIASDLVQNGLPMTIEGAIRNGQQAARHILSQY
ncbi:MAG TPA: hydroxysqualene dehydroxylase HpnE [Candidatus Kapabacteria bacterium]|nr:hydroxysqualene dehydroxylase HpnE [Candidatus Kapabacteria bacterium]